MKGLLSVVVEVFVAAVPTRPCRQFKLLLAQSSPWLHWWDLGIAVDVLGSRCDYIPLLTVYRSGFKALFP